MNINYSNYLKYKKKYLKQKNKIILKIIDNAYIQHGGSGQSSSNVDIIDNLKRNITCPLTLEIFIDPVIAEDGITYERSAIESHFNSGNNRSPMTNDNLSNFNLIPNTTIKNIINNIIDMGVLDMESIKEYLRASTTSIRETLRRLDVINRNASKYHGEELNIQLEFLKVTAIAVHYNFNESGQVYKNIYIVLNCNRVLLFRIRQGESIFEISETSLPHNVDAHIHPVNEGSLDNIIILNDYSIEEIKQTIEQKLLSENFNEVVRAELLPNLRVSPRINLRPVIYSFITTPISKNILNYISKIPGFLRREIETHSNVTNNNVNQEIMILQNTRLDGMDSISSTEKQQVFNELLARPITNISDEFKFCGIEIVDDPNQHIMAKVGDEVESIDGSESWTKIVRDQGNVFRLENGRIAKKETQGIRWKIKVNFYIALTGVSGVGKSYIARSLFNQSDIFETDNSSKDSFISQFTSFSNGKRFGVIVVGGRDTTFDLPFIRSNTSVPIFEFRITDYSLQRTSAMDQPVPSTVSTQGESKGESSGIANVVAFREIRDNIELDTTRDGRVEGEDITFEIYLDNGICIEFKEDFGECMHGWTTATLGSFDNIQYDSIPSDATRTNPNIRYLENIHEEEHGNRTDEFIFSNQGRRFSIRVSENGGDAYYPTGGIVYNQSDFLE